MRPPGTNAATTKGRTMKIRIRYTRLALIALVVALSAAGRAAAQAPAAPFPDVPPWHWTYQGLVRDAQAGLLVGYPTAVPELIENTLIQLYDGFVHSRAPEARTWIERFTYNRPASWPQPLERSSLARFSLTGVTSTVGADAATATFRAQVTMRSGETATTPMRVALRLIDGDWKVDYAALAGGSALFR